MVWKSLSADDWVQIPLGAGVTLSFEDIVVGPSLHYPNERLPLETGIDPIVPCTSCETCMTRRACCKAVGPVLSGPREIETIPAEGCQWARFSSPTDHTSSCGVDGNPASAKESVSEFDCAQSLFAKSISQNPLYALGDGAQIVEKCVPNSKSVRSFDNDDFIHTISPDAYYLK